jgi:hypothetical protein
MSCVGDFKRENHGDIALGKTALLLNHWSTRPGLKEVNTFWSGEALRHVISAELYYGRRPQRKDSISSPLYVDVYALCVYVRVIGAEEKLGTLPSPSKVDTNDIRRRSVRSTRLADQEK